VSYSATISLRTPAQANGLNTVRLQIILNRKVTVLPLGFSWPLEFFDKEGGYCLTSLPVAQRPANYKELLQQLRAAVGEEPTAAAKHNNLVVGKALGDANAVFRRYHLSDLHLSTDLFVREYNSSASRADFLDFMETRIKERFKRGQISECTRMKHVSTLNKLREFAGLNRSGHPGALPTLPFNALTHKFAGDFDAWLKKRYKSCVNTRSGRHRNVKAYLELARRDKVVFEDPYQYFVNSTVAGKWKALTLEELRLIEEHYATLPAGNTHRRMLQKFLFSCHCGLRLGDLKATDYARIEGQRMELKPHKTYRYDEKELVLPITRRALAYLNESRIENECAGFHLYTDQYTNRQLQVVGERLGIATKLHHHIGRETFATNFIRRGGKVEVLQKLLGHKKLSMTMKYVHVDEAMKQAEIDRLDAMDEA
jgi:integrase